MAFKLIESAQRRWRMVNAPHLVALVQREAGRASRRSVTRPQHPVTNRSRGVDRPSRLKILIHRY
jgi:hypothetical protein